MKICPNCKTKMSDTYKYCSVCGGELPEPQQQSENTVFNEQKNYKTGFIIGGFILVSVIVAAIIIPKSSVENQRALSLYDRAYESLYVNDMTYTSEETAKLIGQARNVANSILVLPDTKKQIEELYETAGDYTLLGEAEEALYSRDMIKGKNAFSKIKDNEVKKSDRYTAASDLIDILEFKANNKNAIEQAMSELSVSSSWTNNYDVNYYCGYATLLEYNTDHVEILLEDYNNDYYYLNFYYQYGSDSDSWNSSIDGVKERLQSGAKCVLAVAVVSTFNYPDRIISYNRIYE